MDSNPLDRLGESYVSKFASEHMEISLLPLNRVLTYILILGIEVPKMLLNLV
ncbi:hypothetical protein SAMN05421752_1348 [Natronorubrum thiooxidans]|uniref:Uncharacterized protein n=1 Tax=Natronorubrum thiooxidans TaxID=308853 RepID=A0A1N7H8U2_9EURY|nr:hypothetical protein SAMN05421752_1348 [Natronorubrum thiooxidans]